jgi:hypothetical protein
MSRPVAVFGAVFAAGLVALLAFAVLEKRDQAFTLGVSPAAPLVAHKGQTICQRPIDVPADFRGVGLILSPPGVRASIEVRDATTGTRLASGNGRASGAGVFTTSLDREVPEGSRIDLCIHGPVSVFGNAPLATRSSEALLDGKPLHADIAAVFRRSNSASLLQLTGDVLERASLFHGSWVKPWLMGLLGLLLLTAFPLLLGAALRESSR